MQAYKLKGKIDESGHLVTKPIDMIPGEVEVIILQIESVSASAKPSKTSKKGTATKAVRLSCKAWTTAQRSTERSRRSPYPERQPKGKGNFWAIMLI